jgi:hypothetical protein
MTALSNQITNTNPLQTTKFLVTFPRIKGVQYFCQKINLPGISINSQEQATPFVNLPVASTKPTFEDLNITFMVDENLQGWREIHRWIQDLGITTSFKDYQDLKKMKESQYQRDPYSDGIMTILSALNNPKWRITFTDMFPTSISGIDFSTEGSADDILTATATFKYAYYNIEKIG